MSVRNPDSCLSRASALPLQTFAVYLGVSRANKLTQGL